MFTSDGMVKLNMQAVNLPYHSGGSRTLPAILLPWSPCDIKELCSFYFLWWSIGDINIFHASSFHIILQTTFGLQIQIQHVPLMQIYVSLEQSYRTKTRGKWQLATDLFNINLRHKKGPVPCTDNIFGSFRIVWELQHDPVWWHDHSSGDCGRDGSNFLQLLEN